MSGEVQPQFLKFVSMQMLWRRALWKRAENQIFRRNCFFQPQLSDTRRKGTTARSDKGQKQESGNNESKLFLDAQTQNFRFSFFFLFRNILQ